ncbi:MAG: PIN domain-containing protein [Candidatus Korarchaeota archaeon]|nr:PIN domain-containing protein [Candidatus Korarchaeota archaeon]
MEKVVVDTYALLAMAFGELPRRAERAMMAIRRREVEGVVPPTVPYEFAVHWSRGRLPGLKSSDEIVAFFSAFFTVVDLSLRDYVGVAMVKDEGDGILSSSGDPKLSSRRLSLVDASVIYTARKVGAPIITGDMDLSHVASSMGLEVIW